MDKTHQQMLEIKGSISPSERRKITISLVIFSLIIFCHSLWGQKALTPYDDLPGLYSIEKPAYTSEYPVWGKMLYQYPVNYLEVKDAFETASSEEMSKWKALRRYGLHWLRRLQPFSDDQGHIHTEHFETFQSNLHFGQTYEYHHPMTEDAPTWEFLGPKQTFWLNTSPTPQSTNPCPWQVNVYSLAIDPNNSDVLYAGTETGFVNKTVDGGENWTPVALDYPFGGGISAIAIDPHNQNQAWVSAGNQIHVTTDGGETWAPLLTSGARFSANHIEASTRTADRLLASANDGVYVSRDGGQSFDKTWHEKTFDIHSSPASDNIVFALTVQGDAYAFIESVDGGQTWTRNLEFPQDIQVSSGGLLAVTPDNPDLVMALLLSSDDTPQLLSYSYQGTWEVINMGRTASLEMDNGQGYYDLALEIAPFSENIVYAGTTSLFKSEDGGVTFKRIGGYGGSFPIHPDIQDMKIVSENNTWVATDGGLTQSTDNFTDTQNAKARINGLLGSDMWGFDQGWNEDITVGGRYHNGNTAISEYYGNKALRMGGAEAPTGWVLSGRSRHVAFSDLGKGWILPPDAESAAEGRFSFTKYPSMYEYGGRRGNLIIHPQYYEHIFLGNETSLWKSTDMGANFEIIYDFGDQVRALQMSQTNDQILYADVVNQGLVTSRDGGYTWEGRPSLTDGTYGQRSWMGKLSIAISPQDENTLYACLSNGTWSTDKGKIFRSEDGGETWEDMTGTLDVFMKSIVIQPDDQGNDILYLSTIGKNNIHAKVYYWRTDDMDWKELGSGFPAGFDFTHTIPFFRDGKIRAAGNAGVWEHDLIQQSFPPVLNAWAPQPVINCIWDTIQLDDHSIVYHDPNIQWTWDIQPSPVYISDIHARNPKVVLGGIDDFDVTLNIEQGGLQFSKTFPNMLEARSCPSIEDCSNPDYLDKTEWTLLYVDSEDSRTGGTAVRAFDGDVNTIWHTRWSTGLDSLPHEIQIDLGQTYEIHEFAQTPRQSGTNGRIKDYELYLSLDQNDWGIPVETGEFTNIDTRQSVVLLSPKKARYIRLRCLSEVNGGPWTSVAEIDMKGCLPETTPTQTSSPFGASAFPVPCEDQLTIELPGEVYHYEIFTMEGQRIISKKVVSGTSQRINMMGLPQGTYLIHLTGKDRVGYNIKVIKK